MRTTFMANAQNVQKEWFVVDAAGQTVGRLASQVAMVLRGKHKPTFTPHADCGDHVIIINAEKVVFTGKKLEQKVYRRHSGYAGGMKETKARDMLKNHPERILMHAIKGMLPKNSLGRTLLTNVRIYAGNEHEHEAQQPKELTFNK
ncbi:50S ribosomal protein L13 [Candidatus Epulonipiscium fishelsonii]|uniref:50S ribosomal protein L13 n=1 Tax=Candidatus Epulonipiscium fishelsonii TaxID=77094 RepID=A0ACC8XFG4_9FIRM|nr:50S ribosomal protein L13 [Epulopiscium sp. SCG-B05WGA-EpuloA1]ONI41966.1 50S ribosomal protein L13 [Epulopiscium sp. SCG-B11WGA-EpuloA1]